MTTEKAAVSAANFKQKLASIKTRGFNLGADVQAALMFAIEYAVECETAGGELIYVSDLRQCVHNTHGLNVKRFDAYTLAHLAGIVKTKNKNDEFIFKATGKLAMIVPTTSWFDYAAIKTEKAPTSLGDYIDSARKFAERGLDKVELEAHEAAQLVQMFVTSNHFKQMLAKRMTELHPNAASETADYLADCNAQTAFPAVMQRQAS